MLTYSVKPRGGVVHAVAVAEALAARGHHVELFALAREGEALFRPTRVPVNLVRHTPIDAPFDERIQAMLEAYTEGLRPRLLRGGYDVIHSQDCLSANAALNLRNENVIDHVLRTVHHVDDFTSPSLVECQDRSILAPDDVLCVSQPWVERLAREYGVAAGLVPNGVDPRRFRPPRDAAERARARRAAGVGDRFTVLTVGAISIFYLHVPSAVGIGAYKVDANFVAGGGIYQNANVTYRGVTVGRVESVGLTNDGVVAHMRLNSGTPVPDNVTATVKSVSAVGEQYIDLVPPDKPSPAKLRNGASIGQDRTAIGQDISGLLDEADRLVASVGDTRIKDLLRESFNAFNGSGPELARMIESSRMLVDEANANYGQVDQLIDQAGPFLDAQIRGGDDIKSLSEGLARLTGHVADADPQLRTTLQTVPGATQAANETFSGIRPSFPVLAARRCARNHTCRAT